MSGADLKTASARDPHEPSSWVSRPKLARTNPADLLSTNSAIDAHWALQARMSREMRQSRGAGCAAIAEDGTP